LGENKGVLIIGARNFKSINVFLCEKNDVEKIAMKTKERITEQDYYRNNMEAQRSNITAGRQSQKKITKNLNILRIIS
jgi:hypothetical protein